VSYDVCINVSVKPERMACVVCKYCNRGIVLFYFSLNPKAFVRGMDGTDDY